MHSRTICLMWGALLLTTHAACAADALDLSNYRPQSDVVVRAEGKLLHVEWPITNDERGVLVLSLDANAPLIQQLGVIRGNAPITSLLDDVNPVTFLTVGSRNLEPQGWMAFFDNPPRRPHETFEARLDKNAARVESHGLSTTVIVETLTAGPFRGNLQLTVYPHCALVHVEAVLSTDEDARAILYDAGLASAVPNWKTVSWMDNRDQFHVVPATASMTAAPIAVRHRAIIVSNDKGSVAVFPPPHQFLYPLDFSDNFKLVWHGPGFRTLGEQFGFGVRQPPEGDGRFVPWTNAPPGTQQRLGVFYLLHRGPPKEALEQVRRFTHGDRFEKLDGYRTFTSHYHVEHTLDFLKQQAEQKTTGVPQGLEVPPFVQTFQRHGVDIVHLAEFHVNHTPEFRTQRLPQLQAMHAECRRLSDEDFLLLPGEEPNVHLGGHWISFFPRPVYWILRPEPDVPFERHVDGIGTVYAVHSPADVLRLMEKEQGLMWTAHARTKSSFGFPDKYREQDFYQSDRFLGAAWKAMPADLSLPRLGTRVLDLFDDMNHWGPRKQVLGEVDVFKVFPDHELYGHMNINYLKLDALPRFDDGWHSVLNALRNGQFFVTTGEVLVPQFRVGDKESGETLKLGSAMTADVTARLTWTFPPSFAEVIFGDGTRVQRQRIDLREQSAFSHYDLRVPIDLAGAKWVRLEAWDIAANGAFTQPVWIED